MKTYNVILTDPPWPQTKGGKRRVRPKQGNSLDYPTLSLDEIRNIHIAAMELAEPAHVSFV